MKFDKKDIPVHLINVCVSVMVSLAWAYPHNNYFQIGRVIAIIVWFVVYIYQYFFVPGKKFLIHLIVLGALITLIEILTKVVDDLYGGILILILMLYIWKMNRDIDNKEQKS